MKKSRMSVPIAAIPALLGISLFFSCLSVGSAQVIGGYQFFSTPASSQHWVILPSTSSSWTVDLYSLGNLITPIWTDTGYPAYIIPESVFQSDTEYLLTFTSGSVKYQWDQWSWNYQTGSVGSLETLSPDDSGHSGAEIAVGCPSGTTAVKITDVAYGGNITEQQNTSNLDASFLGLPFNTPFDVYFIPESNMTGYHNTINTVPF